MKKNEKGFSIIELCIVIVVLGLIVVAGWFVWGKQQKPDKAKPANVSSSTQKQASVKLLSGTVSQASKPTADELSTIDEVSFVRPADWRPDANITADGCGIQDCLGQVYIVPENEDEDGAGYPDYFVVTMSAFKTNEDAKATFATNWQDSDPAAESAYSDFVTSEGVKGFKYDFEYNGTDAKGNYTEHVAYGISDGTHVAIIDATYFNGAHNSFANKTNTDYGKYAATVEQIAKSLHIAESK